MDEKAIQAIIAILKRGNDIKIKRKGDGYIIMEEKITIKHYSPA